MPEWMLPWIRLHLAIRAMLTERRGAQWPPVKAELAKAIRETMRRAPW